MLKHALLTALLVTVASALGATLAQVSGSSQASVAIHDKMMKSTAMTPSGSTIDIAEVELVHGKGAAMKKIKEFKKRQAGQM